MYTHMQTHTEVYNIKSPVFSRQGLGTMMFFGKKMAEIKEAFCIFKKESLEDPLKFYFTVQE